jgi:hypothetical protein
MITRDRKQLLGREGEAARFLMREGRVRVVNITDDLTIHKRLLLTGDDKRNC